MPRKPPPPAASGAPPNPADAFEAAARKMLEVALSLHARNLPLKCKDVSALVADVCARAQARGIEAERLIIELKQIWHSVPESEGHRKADVISRLVSMCITDFYKSHPAKGA